MVDWSDDRIAALSDQDLKNLLVNAERKSAADMVAQCKAEIEKRDAAKPRKASKPRTELKEFEHDDVRAACRRRQGDGREIRSVGGDRESQFGGRQGIQAHKLLDAKGYAKLGGMQRDGTVAVDRYISYRRGNGIVSLGVCLLEGRADRDPRISCQRAGRHARGRQAVCRNSADRDGSAEAAGRQRARLQGPAERGGRLRRGAGENHGVYRKIPRHCEVSNRIHSEHRIARIALARSQ